MKLGRSFCSRRLSENRGGGLRAAVLEPKARRKEHGGTEATATSLD